MQIKFLVPVALGFLLGAAPLSAGELSFGTQGGLFFPSGDLKSIVDSRAGFDAGLFAVLDLGGGKVLRPRFDWFQVVSTPAYTGPLNLSGTTPTEATITENKQVKAWALGVDFLRYFSKDMKAGLYFYGGLGLSYNTYDVGLKDSSGTNTASDGYSIRSTKLYWNLGGGYQFNSFFGLEGGYRRSELGAQSTVATDTSASTTGSATSTTSTQYENTQTLGYLTLGVTVRF